MRIYSHENNHTCEDSLENNYICKDSHENNHIYVKMIDMRKLVNRKSFDKNKTI